MAKTVTYTERDAAIVNALKNYPEGLTFNELKEVTGLELMSAHVVATIRKGLVKSTEGKDVDTKVVRPVTFYNYVTSEPTKNEEGKVNTYTANETALLKVAATMEGAFSLADLATAMGKEKLSSGSINGLVKKGNISKEAEMRKVARIVPKPTKVYMFVSDIPEGVILKG